MGLWCLEKVIFIGSMASRNSLSLSTIINDNTKSSAFPRGSNALFIPKVILDWVTFANIIQHFKETDNGDQRLDESFVGYILNHLRELFAISIAIAMPAAELIRFIKALQKSGVTDNDIPQIHVAFEKFPRLNQVWLRHVRDHRYMFRAPEFSQQSGSTVPDIDPKMPLPIDFCHEKSWTGGFGTVYQIRIHPLFEAKSVSEVRLS